MAQIVFCLVILAALFYVCVRKQKDLFTLAILFAIFVSISLCSGVVSYPSLPDENVAWQIYATYTILILTLIAYSVPCSRDFWHFPVNSTDYSVYWPPFLIIFVIWSSVLVLMVSKFGLSTVFFSHKSVLMGKLPVGIEVFNKCSLLLITAFFSMGTRKAILLGCVVSVVSLMLGSRTPFILGVLGALIGWLYNRRIVISLGSKMSIRLLSFGTIFVIFGSSLKALYSDFRYGGFLRVAYMFEERGVVGTLMSGLEFVKVNYIFVVFVNHDFQTNGLHFLRGVLSLLPIPRGWYTTGSGEFYDLYKPALFPHIDWGMAYNSLGEVYVFGGLLGVFLYANFFSGVIYLLHRGMLVNKNVFVLLLCSISAMLVFYSYRNSLGVNCGFVRNMFYPMLFVGLLVSYGAKSRALCRRNIKLFTS